MARGEALQLAQHHHRVVRGNLLQPDDTDDGPPELCYGLRLRVGGGGHLRGAGGHVAHPPPVGHEDTPGVHLEGAPAVALHPVTSARLVLLPLVGEGELAGAGSGLAHPGEYVVLLKLRRDLLVEVVIAAAVTEAVDVALLPLLTDLRPAEVAATRVRRLAAVVGATA